MVDSAKEIDAGWLDSKMVMYGFFFLLFMAFFLYTHNGRNAIVLFNSTS